MKTTVLFMVAVFSTFVAAAVQDDVSAPFSAAGLSPAAVTKSGGLSFGGAEIGVVAYAPGWKRLPVKAEWISAPEIGHGAFTIAGENGITLFRGRSVWRQGDRGSVTGRVEVSCIVAAEVQCLALMASVSAEPPFGLGDGSAAAFDLPLSDGRAAQLAFEESVPYHAQDSRQWGGKWSVRFGKTAFGPRSYAPGDNIVWEMTVSAPDGLALSIATPIEIAEGPDWARLDFRKDIVHGSALDFSGMGLQDAPAGKHGWLKAVGGHFEFEGLPGTEQRFYGVNLCFTANYPDHDVADRLVDLLVRSGYNSVRIHHHDGAWAAAHAGRTVERSNSQTVSPPPAPTVEPSDRQTVRPSDRQTLRPSDRQTLRPSDPQTLRPSDRQTLRPSDRQTLRPSDRQTDDDIDRLDYLLARCFERGIYATTDLYVSRKAPWRDIGIDRDGVLNQNLYKTYVGIHDGAFADWCRWTRAFLEHVNPYTGRAYKDEPGLPLLSLINEGILGMGWEPTGKATDPVIHKAWEEYGGEGATPSPDSKDFARFDEWVQRRTYERCAAFVRSLGCRALLTNENNGRLHGEGEGTTPLFDYVDSHFYVDHPTFIDKPWTLPSKCGNDNLIKANKPAIFHRGWAKGASKPYTISEWNIAHPGVYRGMGGILTGALAAEQEWDGLWRFAYSHSRDNLLDSQNCSGYFDCAADPLIAASDRASVCLYLRGDAQQQADDSKSALRLDKARGSMALVTPRTCGGFAESGRVEAGPLCFTISRSDAEKAKTQSEDEQHSPENDLRASAPSAALREPETIATTLWASSLDGAPLVSSSRILLVHLTDVQGEGAKFADAPRRILLAWGKVPLVAAGAADVELHLSEGPGTTSPTVWALDTAGRRMAEVPASFADGALRFRVSARGTEGGRLYYEIVR